MSDVDPSGHKRNGTDGRGGSQEMFSGWFREAGLRRGSDREVLVEWVCGGSDGMVLRRGLMGGCDERFSRAGLGTGKRERGGSEGWL